VCLCGQGAEEDIWDEVTEGWRKLHNEELHNMHTNQNDQVKEHEMGRATASVV
jgi:hypothetical protein